MARTKRGTPPSYRRHSGGQACVTVRDHLGRRREILLGPWGSAESRAEYARALGELAANQGRLPAGDRGAEAYGDLTMNELLVAYWGHAEAHYRRPDGRPSGELANMKDALRPVKELFGGTLARHFDAAALEALQAELVRRRTLARTTINGRVNRVRRVIRWGVRKKLVPGEVLLSIDAVPGLQRGRTPAREPEGVRPVSWEHVEAASRFMPRPIAAAVTVQWLCGCRAGEVLVMRGQDLSPGEPNWAFRPKSHKNDWRGQGRTIVLGPRAVQVIQEFLRPDPSEYLFRPCDAVAEHHARRAAARRTRRTPSELKRLKPSPGASAGAPYSRRSYRQAVVRACRKAGVPTWSPLGLRHGRATQIRAAYSLEVVQCVLGHARADTSEIYAARNELLAARVMAEIG
jgi:integrase